LRKTTQKISVFVDTSVLIAALASVSGASALVLDLCEAGAVQIVISRQVLVEADRNISSKLPGLIGKFRRFIKNLAPLLVEDPTLSEVKKASSLIHKKDASILAAARKSQVDYLITLDKNHFLASKERARMLVPVVTPAEFLQIFEKLYLEGPQSGFF
jgi:putative PIN family toxin of toxin-antitoxin system